MTNPITEEFRDRTGRTMTVVFLIVLVGCGGAALAFFAVAKYLRTHHLGNGWMIGAAAAYGAVILIVAYIAMRIGRRISGQTCTPAMKRYQRRTMAASALYVAALIGAIAVHRLLPPDGWEAYAVAVAPALPVIGVIVTMGLYLRDETDEFQRAVHAEAALWATGGLLAIATVWGFLEMFGLVVHVEAWAAFPIWAVFQGPGYLIARRRYR